MRRMDATLLHDVPAGGMQRRPEPVKRRVRGQYPKPAAGGPIPPKLMPHVIGAPDFIFRPMVLKRQKIDANARSSMADDFAAKRTTEVD